MLRRIGGFFRTLPLLSIHYHPLFTYHAKRWYTQYMLTHGEFHTLFNHRWVHSKEISNPDFVRKYRSLAFLLVRGIVENPIQNETETLPIILNRAVRSGFNHIIVAIDDIEGLRLNKRRTRTIESLVTTSSFDSEYSNWLKRVRRFFPTVVCRSKSVILQSYGIYELGRAALRSSTKTKSSIQDSYDMLDLDFPLLVMDILLKISRRIPKPYPSTYVTLSEIKRLVQPWFDNKKEVRQIVTRCYEKVPDLTDKTQASREELGRRVEAKLLSWSQTKQAIQVFKQIQEVVHCCAI